MLEASIKWFNPWHSSYHKARSVAGNGHLLGASGAVGRGGSALSALASYARSSRTSHARLLFTMDDRGDLHTIVGEELRAARLPTTLERTIFQRTRSEELHLDTRVSWHRHAPCGVHGECHWKQTCTRVTTDSCHELRRVGIALRGFQPL